LDKEDLKDIVLRGIPNSWKGEMHRQGFDYDEAPALCNSMSGF